MRGAGGLERQTTTEIYRFLSGLDWSGERIGAEIKEDMEDTEDVENLDDKEATEGVEGMEDMEFTEDNKEVY
jgi:hypothetical protein